MRHIPPILPALLLLLPAASPAEPLAVHEWDARPADPRPYAGRIPHGSAARLVARLPAAPSSATFHWQTNGMGSAWWEAPAECLSNAVSVLWTPAMDSGAPVHRAFFRIAQPEGPDYSAFATLAMLDSPGFVPNALPMPVERLDFAAVAWTNAPWLESYTESDPTVPAWAKAESPPDPDIPTTWPASAITNAPWLTAHQSLAGYATTGDVASAIAAIPAPDPPDLSAYATTSAVASAVAAMHPDFEEWASPTVDRISASVVAPSTTSAPRGDTIASTGRASGYALRAVRSMRSSSGMDSEVEIEGAWSIVGSTSAANLASNVLSSTTRPGDVTVEFTASDGSATMRAAVSMPGDAVRTSTVWPSSEVSGTWRSNLYCPIADDGLFTVSTTQWNGSTYVCTNWTDFIWAPPWYATPAVNSGGGLVGVAPHYAMSSTHCGEFGPKTWSTGASSGRGVSIATFGDLRLLRMPSAVPTNCVARFLRASVLASLSDSLCFRALGCAHTQHGYVAPCLIEPRPSRADLTGATWDNGWAYVGAGREWRNATYAHVYVQFLHAAHQGDSGHPVWFFDFDKHAHIPVGLFHWADGSGECLLSDSLLDRIDAAIRRDSGGAESLSYYTAEDLQ